MVQLIFSLVNKFEYVWCVNKRRERDEFTFDHNVTLKRAVAAAAAAAAAAANISALRNAAQQKVHHALACPSRRKNKFNSCSTT